MKLGVVRWNIEALAYGQHTADDIIVNVYVGIHWVAVEKMYHQKMARAHGL